MCEIIYDISFEADKCWQFLTLTAVQKSAETFLIINFESKYLLYDKKLL